MITLSYFKPLTVNDSIANGGSFSGNPVINYRRNNLFPDVSTEEVIDGYTRYRKFFIIPNEKLTIIQAFALPSTADDAMLIRLGTDTDTQAEADDYTGWKGAGALLAALSVGLVTTISVQAEYPGVGFNDNDLIRIGDDENEDFVRVKTVSWSGRIATMTMMPFQYITSSYLIGDNASALVEISALITSQAIWIKEMIPEDIQSYMNNLTRLTFKGRN
jgi:hypothetical protein